MPAGRHEELVIKRIVIAADTRHDRELVLDRIGILGIGTHFLLVAVEVVERSRSRRNPRGVVSKTLAVVLQMSLCTDDQRRPVGEIVVVHEVQ